MADKSVNDLGTLASPANDDMVPIWDTSAGQLLKVRRDLFNGGTLTGSGTIATGGFTLTVPATGTAALLGTAQTYTRQLTVAPISSDHALSVDMAADASTSARVLRWSFAGALRGFINSNTGANLLTLSAFDNGADVGPSVQVFNNNNATTPAAGFILLTNKAGSGRRLWVDAAGDVRTWTGNPTGAADTSGTVVGTQTSNAAFKDVIGLPVSDAEALANVVAAADLVRRFRYKSGSFNGQEFSGIILDGPEPMRYGMDADSEHPAGKSLNETTLLGDLVLAVRQLSERVQVLEAALDARNQVA